MKQHVCFEENKQKREKAQDGILHMVSLMRTSSPETPFLASSPYKQIFVIIIVIIIIILHNSFALEIQDIIIKETTTLVIHVIKLHEQPQLVGTLPSSLVNRFYS